MTLGRGVTIVVALFLISAAPATQPGASSSISGRVLAKDADRALSQIVVYLEPTDAGQRFAPPAATAIISQRDATFIPSLLVIAKGQTVEFRNDESRAIEHNVFSRSPTQSFDLGLYLPPTDKRVAFNTPGVVRLYCSIHRLMDGVIYICPTPFWAQVDANGSFSITNVPAGNWKIRTWQRNAKFNEAEAPVKTEGAGRANVDLKLSRD